MIDEKREDPLVEYRPVVGIDLDNTLICYDSVYLKLADELGVDVPNDANPRDILKRYCKSKTGGNFEWTLLQGRIYGELIREANLFKGASETIQSIIDRGFQVKIISHKSIYSAVGPIFDFRQSASEFIEKRIVSGLSKTQKLHFTYTFCQTLEEKVLEITNSGCVLFVDDLEPVLNHPLFPKQTKTILFQNKSNTTWHGIAKALSTFDFPCMSPNRSNRCFCTHSFCNLLQSIHEEMESMDRLSGGINNEVYKIICKSGNVYCGKFYRRDPGDARDRMHHEIRFLEYCCEHDVSSVPQICALDWENGAAIFSFIDGCLWPSEEPVPENLWNQFQCFFEKLQTFQTSDAAERLPRAAEGAFSIQEHLGWVHKRRDIWLFKSENAELDEETTRYILNELEPRYQDIAKSCIESEGFEAKFSVEDNIINPSDFGLHNALVDENSKLWFIDFEYAGWDNKCKCIADFSSQPRYPCPKDFFLSETSKPRSCSEFVMDLISLKWEYIKLAADGSNRSPSQPNQI